jgi:hypothetical protein
MRGAWGAGGAVGAAVGSGTRREQLGRAAGPVAAARAAAPPLTPAAPPPYPFPFPTIPTTPRPPQYTLENLNPDVDEVYLRAMVEKQRRRDALDAGARRVVLGRGGAGGRALGQAGAPRPQSSGAATRSPRVRPALWEAERGGFGTGACVGGLGLGAARAKALHPPTPPPNPLAPSSPPPPRVAAPQGPRRHDPPNGLHDRRAAEARPRGPGELVARGGGARGVGWGGVGWGLALGWSAGGGRQRGPCCGVTTWSGRSGRTRRWGPEVGVWGRGPRPGWARV